LGLDQTVIIGVLKEQNRRTALKLEPHFSKRLDLGIKLAKSRDEVQVAQRLRYQVFHEELGAVADFKTRETEMDCDSFDEVCDHLLVTRPRTETSNNTFCINDEDEVVGTYRMLRQSVASSSGGFYSQGEFNIAPLFNRKPDLSFLELGRSCVLAAYRGTPVIELLWQGIWDYVRHHKIDVMFGCASFDGVDPDAHADTLSFLGHHTKSPEEWNVRAHEHRYVEMKRKPLAAIDCRRAMLSLPPLIKGYLRLGSYIGEGAVIDHAFNTTDVLVVLPVSSINPRYFAHFGAPTN
jgi:L-ornithine Nalpha-acyltransferase